MHIASHAKDHRRETACVRHALPTSQPRFIAALPIPMAAMHPRLTIPGREVAGLASLYEAPVIA
jgi:hypothetical protein